MELIFENEKGRIEMDGGKGNFPYKIKSIEGLGFINQSASVQEFPFLYGQKTVCRSPMARLITVSFDCGEAGKACEGELSKISHDEGKLYIKCNEKSVYADCYVSSLGKSTTYKNGYEGYVIQFTCDYPYFFSEETKVYNLFARKELIKNSFVLPMIFSERTVGQNIFLEGDKEVYPTISVGKVGNESDFAIVLKNESTGAVLSLTMPAKEYELIKFDLREGKVSSCKEDLTSCLDDESYMSEFFLRPGENKICITAGGIDVNSSAIISFEEEYISALEE